MTSDGTAGHAKSADAHDHGSEHGHHDDARAPGGSGNHAQGHDHNHTPTITASNEHTVLSALVLTAGFMVAEFIGGLLSGSLALIADAGHMLTDAAAQHSRDRVG